MTKASRMSFIAFSLFAVYFVLTAWPSEAKVPWSSAERAWRRLSKVTGFEASLELEEKDETNAYITAKDGGYVVVVYQGLLDILASEDEIAGVMGHEMGHGIRGHLKSTQKHAAGIGILSMILSELLDSKGADLALEIGSTLAIQGYSREQEVEADDSGVEFSSRAGYSPWGLYSSIKRMSEGGHVTSPSGFNSHPPTERRMTHLANQAEFWEEKLLSLKDKSKVPERPDLSEPSIVFEMSKEPQSPGQSGSIEYHETEKRGP